ncbi:MAG: family 16 glycoside hydrolase [Cytophagales bacterium]|nr:family 16 glycoside hydrolase [Cytophagales bacterium]
MKNIISTVIIICQATCIIYAQSISRFESDIVKFENENKTLAPSNDRVVLYGSSSFTNWKKCNEHLAPYNIINRGFGGSNSAEALYYFKRVILPIKPKIILYYEGDNDLVSGFIPDSVYANFRLLATMVNSNLPGTQLVVVSIKQSPMRKIYIDKQKLLNAMLRGYALANKNIGYIDITPLQYDHKGNFDPAMYLSDSLHVSDDAYLKWAVRIKQYLDKQIGKPKPKENWVSIFNGKDFEGWEQKGGVATYQVIDGAVVGTTVANTPNSFMCTQKKYKDFILEFEVWADTMLNSGLQFRSNSKAEYNNGVVYGYQCEIDPSPRAYSGGIYDEQRRGWLYKPADDSRAQKAFNRMGWNKYRIEAIGYSLKTYINGIPVSDIIDTMEPSGFIGLQVHSIYKSDLEVGKQVKWRNIKICEINP